MQVDHFDGKSIKNKSRLWLAEAINDALLKAADCATPSSDGRFFPCHERMWRAKAAEYKSELDNR